MVKIYGAKAPMPTIIGLIRDLRPIWLLQELGLPYERVSLDPTQQENLSPAYVALNPFGKIPTMQDDGLVLFESAAICWHLAEKHQKFIPRDPAGRAHSLQWVFAATTSLEPSCNRIYGALHMSKDAVFTEKTVEATQPILDRALKTYEKILDHAGYLMKDFTVADILLASTLRSPSRCEFRGKALLDPYPNVRRYLDLCTARPAFQRAEKTNGV